MDVFGTAFLPNILYLHYLLHAHQPVIDLGEHYIKQTQRNRTFILTSNGAMPLIIPLRKSDSQKLLDMEISYAEDWQTKCVRAFRSSYKNSPYYEHYQEEFEDLIGRKEKLLHTFNRHFLDWILIELDAHPVISYREQYIEEDISIDYRNVDFYSPAIGYTPKPYKQVFSYKLPFIPNLSVVDLLFNKGPESMLYLK